jgi:hypothetical protein
VSLWILHEFVYFLQFLYSALYSVMHVYVDTDVRMCL